MTTNPDESKERIERAREFVRSCYGKPQTDEDAAGQDALVNALLMPFAAAENQLLSTRVEELEKENAKYREALEKARTAINEWKGTPHVKTGDIVIRISRYIKSALLTEKHDTAAGEGE